MLPASPKIFYGRKEELTHVVNTITQSKPARIAICGADGLGKTALALATSHSSEVSQMFGIHRYFVECEDAKDSKQLIAALAAHLGVESTSKKHVIRHFSTLAT
jgi:Cdc6-like AAA superfamily ATPase